MSKNAQPLDFLLGSLAFSLVYASLIYQRLGKRIAFVALTLGAAIFANLFRTTSIIFLTDITDGKIELAEDHQLYGWVTFLITLAILMALGLFFADPVPSDDEAATATTERDRPRRTQAPQAALIAAGALTVLLSSLGPAYAAYSDDRSLPAEGIAVCSPRTENGWQVASGGEAWQAIYPNADAKLAQDYSVAGGPAGAGLFLAYYWRQRPGAELVSWENHLTDRDEQNKKSWKWLSAALREVEVEGQSLVVTEARLLAEKVRRRLVWHWYWVDGRYTESRLLAKALAAKVRLLGGERRSAFIALTIEETQGTEAARAVLAELAAQGLGLSAALRETGPGGC